MYAITIHRDWGLILLALLPFVQVGCSAHAEHDEPAAIDTVEETQCAQPSLTTSAVSPQPSGAAITLNASASCDSGAVEYQFAYRLGTGTWTTLANFGPAASATWTTNGLAPGAYTLRVRVRNQGVITTNSVSFVLGESSPCEDAVLVPNVAYSAANAVNVLDLHLPRGVGGPRPILVWIHGGGWTNGTKTLQPAARNKLCPRIADGFAVASVDYRLTCIPTDCPGGDPPTCQDSVFPAQIHDVKAAVRFLRARSTTYGLAGDRVVAWGTSAGGHLAALLGTSAGVAALEGAALGNPDVSSKVQGFIDCYGPTRLQTMDAELEENFFPRQFSHSDRCSAESQLLGCDSGLDTNCPAQQLSRVSPITHVDASDPPALISHGILDDTVPIQQSEDLAAELAAKGVPVVFQERPGDHDINESCPMDSSVDTFLAPFLQ